MSGDRLPLIGTFFQFCLFSSKTDVYFWIFACSFGLAVVLPPLFPLKIAVVPVAEQQRPQPLYPVIRNPKLGICAFLLPKHFLPSLCPVLVNNISNWQYSALKQQCLRVCYKGRLIFEAFP